MNFQKGYLDYADAVQRLAEIEQARNRARARKLICEGLLFEAVLPAATAAARRQLGELPGEPGVVAVAQEGEELVVCLGFFEAEQLAPFSRTTVRIPMAA